MVSNVSGNVSIQLGDGNNTFTKAGPGYLDGVKISAGNGNDLIDFRNRSAELKHTTVSLGEGNNTVHSYDDILDVVVTTGSGNDYIHLEPSPTNPQNNIDISGKFSLGAGDDTIELTAGNIGTWGTQNITGSTYIDMGEGNDKIIIAHDIDNYWRNERNNTVDMGTGDDIVSLTNILSYGTGIVTLNLGAGNDKLDARGNIDKAIVNAGAGKDILTIKGYINNAQINMGSDTDLDVLNVTGSIYGGSKVNMGEGVGEVTIGGNIYSNGTTLDFGSANDKLTVDGRMYDGSVVNLGLGDDVVVIKGNMDNSSQINATGGINTITVNSNMTDSSQIITGDGKDTINIDGFMNNSSKISTGAGNDNVYLKGNMNGSSIDLGSGDDTFHYGGGNISGKVNAGTGNDTFVFTGSAQTLYVDDTTGFERFNLNGKGGELNLSYKDLVDAGTKKVFVDGASNDTLDLGNNGSRLSGFNFTDTSSGNSYWTKASTSDEIGYNKYVYSTDDQYTVYIHTDITNII